ncbi:hypothetical protein OIDMADRAFT_26034 [Oidiodendron maius Zn]|uniref:Uncharacterized protein n=1 Tax=Oidiodendron maius (strain Zn) TaxID=913774 RepID=A0A0C3H558_OIDMZ|nr:hypothetical protein OIDMADRAFT_26034 [Oidiodendron maius Zn]
MNYATKDDISPYQMLVKAALLKQSIEKVKATLTPDARDLWIRKKDMTILLFDASTHSLTTINLWWLRKYVLAAVDCAESPSDGTTGLRGEEQCAYRPSDTVS